MTTSTAGADEGEPFNILLGVTASVAAIKADQVVLELLAVDIPGRRPVVRVLLTERARHFADPAALAAAGAESVQTDADEWEWSKRGDPVLHIEAGKWAHLFLLAPADALTIGKLANGLCDNLVSCALVAWPAEEKPLLLCPAMNTRMWQHPAVARNVATVESNGTEIVWPIAKKLMCGDVGSGAMAEPRSIANAVASVARGKNAPQQRKEWYEDGGHLLAAVGALASLALVSFLITRA